ncbi:hypothetical protein MTO96_047370 [Rhipicephalus appendiculatus]
MFPLDEFRSRYDSGGAWSSDLTYVTRLTERAMDDHFDTAQELHHPLQNSSALPDTEDFHSERCIEMFQSYVQQQAALSPAEAAQICRRTLGEAEHPEWVKERTGRLTASNFFRIVHCVKPEGLIKSILYPKKETLLNPLDPRLYGRQNEAVAVEAYRSLMHLYDKDVEILETGLHVLEEYPFWQPPLTALSGMATKLDCWK